MIHPIALQVVAQSVVDDIARKRRTAGEGRPALADVRRIVATLGGILLALLTVLALG